MGEREGKIPLEWREAGLASLYSKICYDRSKAPRYRRMTWIQTWIYIRSFPTVAYVRFGTLIFGGHGLTYDDTTRRIFRCSSEYFKFQFFNGKLRISNSCRNWGAAGKKQTGYNWVTDQTWSIPAKWRLIRGRPEKWVRGPAPFLGRTRGPSRPRPLTGTTWTTCTIMTTTIRPRPPPPPPREWQDVCQVLGKEVDFC